MPLGPPDQKEIQTTMLETILNLMQRARTIESYVYEVLVINRDSTEATSMVSGARQSRFAKRAAPPFLTFVHAEWPNLECFFAWVAFFFHCLVRDPAKTHVLGFSCTVLGPELSGGKNFQTLAALEKRTRFDRLAQTSNRAQTVLRHIRGNQSTEQSSCCFTFIVSGKHSAALHTLFIPTLTFK